MNPESNPRYLAEYRDKITERHQNDVMLLPRLTEIEQGRPVEVLARFAKAYLGLFLEMDNSIPATHRLSILASPTLVNALWQGIDAVLQEGDLPTTRHIAASMLHEQPLEIGYVVLAGMFHRSEATADNVIHLPAATLTAAVCFYYANKTGLAAPWLPIVMTQRQTEVANALQEFWLQLIDHGMDYLPGLMPVIQEQANQPIARDVLLPVLSQWRHCRRKVLREILLAALQLTDQREFLPVAAAALASWNPQEPARYALWLATAYLLDPPHYAQVLTEYLGRSRERILPLLDFVVLALQNDTAGRYPLSAAAFALLLRNIAPKFTPQEDPSGNLCDNTLRVMYLFYRLACNADPDRADVLAQLQQVRVMKLYAPILDAIQTPCGIGQAPDFDDFVSDLHQAGHIHPKRNWSDLR